MRTAREAEVLFICVRTCNPPQLWLLLKPFEPFEGVEAT